MIHRKTMLLIALVLVGVFAFNTAVAAAASPDTTVAEKEKPAKKGAAVAGKIVSVDLGNSTFTIKSGKGDKAKEVVVTFNGDTKFMLGKDASTSEEVLAADQMVRVMHKDGLAKSVTRQVKKAKPKKKPEGDE